MELKNKNVFITGSSRGIGLAIAHKFASAGANIVLNGRGQISDEVLAEFAGYPVKVVAISGYVSDGAAATRMLHEAMVSLRASSSAIKASTAPVWFGFSAKLTVCFSPFTLKMIRASGKLSFSARQLSKTSPLVLSNTAPLTEELPQFNTRISLSDMMSLYIFICGLHKTAAARRLFIFLADTMNLLRKLAAIVTKLLYLLYACSQS